MEIKNWKELDFANNKSFIISEVGKGFVSRKIQENSDSPREVNQRFTHTAALCFDYKEKDNNSLIVIESHFDGHNGVSGCNKVPALQWFKTSLEKGCGIFLTEHSLDEGRLSLFCELKIRYDLRNILRHKLHSILGISKFSDASPNKVYCTELIAMCDNWDIGKEMGLAPHQLTPEDVFAYVQKKDKTLYDLSDIPLAELESKLYGWRNVEWKY